MPIREQLFRFSLQYFMKEDPELIKIPFISKYSVFIIFVDNYVLTPPLFPKNKKYVQICLFHRNEFEHMAFGYFFIAFRKNFHVICYQITIWNVIFTCFMKLNAELMKIHSLTKIKIISFQPILCSY